MSDVGIEPPEPPEEEAESIAPGKVKLCQHCGIRPAGHGRFGKFCDNEECRAERLGKNEPHAPRATTRRPGRSNLEREIREAMMGTAAVVSISNPGIFVAVEATVDEFAAAWANVARQSPTAERYIRALLTGGVWIAAISSTLVMLVAIMVTTGSVPPRLVPMGWYVVGTHPRLGEYVLMQQAQANPPEEEAVAA